MDPDAIVTGGFSPAPCPLLPPSLFPSRVLAPPLCLFSPPSSLPSLPLSLHPPVSLSPGLSASQCSCLELTRGLFRALTSLSNAWSVPTLLSHRGSGEVTPSPVSAQDKEGSPWDYITKVTPGSFHFLLISPTRSHPREIPHRPCSMETFLAGASTSRFSSFTVLWL